jgi:hypothetical protein
MNLNRHEDCRARLFDTRHSCASSTPDGRRDLSIRCWRCKHVAHYAFELPRLIRYTDPQPVHCANILCMRRICDISLPYIYVNSEVIADVGLMCKECRSMTYLVLEGVAAIQ